VAIEYTWTLGQSGGGLGNILEHSAILRASDRYGEWILWQARGLIDDPEAKVMYFLATDSADVKVMAEGRFGDKVRVLLILMLAR
jgi:hypothetical protein